MRYVILAAALFVALTTGCGARTISTDNSEPVDAGTFDSASCAASRFPSPQKHRSAPVDCSADTIGNSNGCVSDADCGSNVCTCSGTVFGWAHQNAGNVCLRSNCQTDADCATGYCSPTVSFDAGPFYGLAGFYCHTCDDLCENDADCTEPGAFCAFQPVVGRWACSNVHIAG